MGRRVHGDRNGEELEALGLHEVPLLDFSVNLNPLGPAPSVLAAVRKADPVAYPDATGRATCAHVAQWLDVAPTRVAVGAGAAELIWASVRALVPAGGQLFIVGPTFSEAAAAAEAAGASVHEYRPRDGVTIDLQAVADEARRHAPGAIYLCNPNNPTGQLHSEAAMDAFLRRVTRETDAVVLIDEAFLTLSAGHRALRTPTPERVIRLRSLTKDHAIAGVRAAYLTASSDLTARVEAQRAPWSTSRAALHAIRSACSDEGDAHLAASRDQVFTWRDEMRHRLASIGVRVEPSGTLFMLASATSAARAEDGATLRLRLLREHHIVGRDCASFGLPKHVRLCARPPSDVTRLVDAWSAS